MVQRTCLDCGETWTLEASLASMRPGPPRGFGGRIGASFGGPIGANETRIVSREQVAEASAGLDQELETIRQLRTCPKCGGDHYKDRRA
jgi:hypothetical protein